MEKICTQRMKQYETVSNYPFIYNFFISFGERFVVFSIILIDTPASRNLRAISNLPFSIPTISPSSLPSFLPSFFTFFYPL